MARILFAGTPDFAVPSLRALIATQHDVVAVVTQPDRPAGRGRRLRPGPVKVCALQNDIAVYQPAGMRVAGVAGRLRQFEADLMVVVAYGSILPRPILAQPRAGCINVHASLLPRWRGASPIQAALLAGDAQTGVSIMRMAAGLDTGPVFAVRDTPIGAHETAGELQERLADLGATLLIDCLDAILAGELAVHVQDDAAATYAPRIAKADAVIDWSSPAVDIDRQIRAYNPWPVAQTHLDDQGVRCWRSVVVAQDTPPDARPGLVVAARDDGIDVASGRGVVRLVELQLAGGRRVAAAAFARGHDIVGRVLGG